MSSIKCPNCSNTLGCSCQLKTSINGTRCCSKCVGALNEKQRRANNVK